MSLIHTVNRVGKTYQVNKSQLTPIFKSSRVQPPGMWGVLLWHRPASVVLQHPDGTDEIIEIQDPTRKAQLVLLGIALIGSLLITLINTSFSKRKGSND
jgi:hypothetical protein